MLPDAVACSEDACFNMCCRVLNFVRGFQHLLKGVEKSARVGQGRGRVGQGRDRVRQGIAKYV